MDKVKPTAYVNERDASVPLPKVQDFPVSPVGKAATEAFEVWKSQVAMPDLELATDSESNDSLDAFVAQEMPRVGKAAL